MAIQLTSHMIQLHLFRVRRDNLEFLILKRSPNEEIYPSLWQVITGRVEEGETALQAAHREAVEETGLELEEINVLPYVTSFFNTKTDAVNFVPVFAAEVGSDADVILSDEHQEFRWVEADTAEQLLPLPSHREATRVLIDSINRNTLKLFGR